MNKSSWTNIKLLAKKKKKAPEPKGKKQSVNNGTKKHISSKENNVMQSYVEN